MSKKIIQLSKLLKAMNDIEKLAKSGAYEENRKKWFKVVEVDYQKVWEYLKSEIIRLSSQSLKKKSEEKDGN